jgi:hypothetical protein
MDRASLTVTNKTGTARDRGDGSDGLFHKVVNPTKQVLPKNDRENRPHGTFFSK